MSQLHEAFDAEKYPGDDDILHCSYDKRWGGTLDGPCRECAEVVQYFRGKGQYGHNSKQLGWVSYGLVSFTPEAFIYWLPSFIEVAALIPKEADSVSESLEFRFESVDSKEWQDSHIGNLNTHQLTAVKEFFLIQRVRKEVDEETLKSITLTLKKFNDKSS